MHTLWRCTTSPISVDVLVINSSCLWQTAYLLVSACLTLRAVSPLTCEDFRAARMLCLILQYVDEAVAVHGFE